MGKIQNIDGKKFYYNKEEVYEALIKTSKDFIVIGNLKTGIFKYPVEIAKVLDLPSQIIEDPVKYWKNIILEEDWEKFYKSNENFMSGKESFHHVDFRIRNKKNEIVWLKCIGNMMRDKNGIPSTFVGMISLHEKNNKIDPVTRLFVIEEFFKSLEAKLENPPENLGVLILGINNFKRINEFYGRETGDIILRRISGIIQDVIPYSAEVYKLDGTNFGIILEDTSREEIEKIYEIIKDKFEEKQIVSKNEDILAVSVGVAMYPDDGQSYKELYQYAKYSRGYSKRKEGNSITFFSKEFLESNARYLKILYLLKRDIDNGFKNFDIFYQPQIKSKTQEIEGVEALLRWSCEEYGCISPMEFIPILEENNLMVNVGKWVLKQSLETYKKEWSSYVSDLSISVNVSFMQFIDKNFVEDVKKILEESGVNPKNLVLELTESCMVSNINYIKNIYMALKKLGIKIALDDFGTGYSSLGVLKELPIDIVKTDRIFVKNILCNNFDLVFIKFITELCHEINLKICIEGVEQKEEYELVNNLGVDYIQGYYFGKPVPRLEITKKLKDGIKVF